MLPQAIDVELNCLLDEPSHGSPREAPRRFLDDHSAIHAVCCRIKAPLRIVMPDGRCAKPSAMAVGCNGAAPFAADHTPSSTTAVPLPEGSAKCIDEAVLGRGGPCSAFDVDVLPSGGAERETWAPEASKTIFGKKTIANGSFVV